MFSLGSENFKKSFYVRWSQSVSIHEWFSYRMNILWDGKRKEQTNRQTDRHMKRGKGERLTRL
jgi:hypothetical protein